MRQLRQLQKNASYHVVARINRQENVFGVDAFKIMFLNVVAQSKKKYSYKLRNFCIMGNHIHFDITPDEDESLSKIMQWILSVFAVRYNKVYKYRGHLWYDRFKSKIIADYWQFLNTFVYISNNPVRAGLCSHPLDYPFSGITHIINDKFHLVEKPDLVLQKIIENYLQNFDIHNAKESKKDIGFYPKR
jgi:putative transposase